MPRLPIRWITARTYCQATEDEPRVEAALELALPGGSSAKERLAGHFRNPVVVLSRRHEAAEVVRNTWQRWTEAGLLPQLGSDLKNRVDEDGVLHFRLDKQEAAGGHLSLLRGGDAIDVQVKLKAYPAKREEILRVAQSLVAEAA